MATVVAALMKLLAVGGQNCWRNEKGMPGTGSPLSKGVGVARVWSRIELWQRQWKLRVEVWDQPRAYSFCDCVAMTMKATEEVWTPIGIGYRIEQKIIFSFPP